MSYKIGITEAGDAGADMSWVNKMDSVDGAVLITKRISPNFYDAVLAHKENVIVHATLTGYGRTALEPCVPPPYEEIDAINVLVNGGFPKEKVVIRVDPIIPTGKGLDTALNVIKTMMEFGFARYRVSVIDMYPHVRSRFVSAGLPLPYGDMFSPSNAQLTATNDMLAKAKEFWRNIGNSPDDLRIESCAEPGLTETIIVGCISLYDLHLLGLNVNEDTENFSGYQRKNCLCYSGKTELLEHRNQCAHGCLYCYWRHI